MNSTMETRPNRQLWTLYSIAHETEWSVKLSQLCVGFPLRRTLALAWATPSNRRLSGGKTIYYCSNLVESDHVTIRLGVVKRRVNIMCCKNVKALNV